MRAGTVCRFSPVCNLFRFRILYPFPGYQQPVGIDAIRRTGHKGTIVLPLPDAQQTGICGKHGIDFKNLISKHIPQHPEIEHIPHFQLLQISKHGLASHSAVA